MKNLTNALNVPTSQKTALILHRRIHTGEKPYKCYEKPYKCYSAIRKQQLVRHRWTQASKNRYRSFGCSFKFNGCHKSTSASPKRNYIEENSHTFHESSQASNSRQNDSVEGPIFVKPLPFVKFLTFQAESADSLLSSSSLLPSSFSSYQPVSHMYHPVSHMYHPVSPLTFLPGEFVFTPPPTVSPSYFTSSYFTSSHHKIRFCGN